MQEEKPLLSEFLEELKTYKEGAFLDSTISIFYNVWSVNPYCDSLYSKRVTLIIAKLKNINPKEYQSYRVAWWDQVYFDPKFVDICVEEKE